MSNSTTESEIGEPGFDTSHYLVWNHVYQGREPFEVVLPAHLISVDDDAQAYYVMEQFAHGCPESVPDFSGPITPWTPLPRIRRAAARSLEAASLADIGPEEWRYVRMRFYNRGQGYYRVWICPGDRIVGIVDRLYEEDTYGPTITKRHQRKERPGWVYVMATSDDGPYKIGRSVDVGQRLKAIQKMNGDELRVLRQWPTDDHVEDEKHMHTKLYRSRQHGEWFGCPLSEIDATAAELGLVAE